MSKIYIVIHGYTPGIYKTWDECKVQVTGFSNPKFKSFKEEDLEKGNIDQDYLNFYNGEIKKDLIKPQVIDNDEFIKDAICVDGACSGNPGLGEYQCVDIKTGEQIFSSYQYENTTNNLMEFFALCEAVKHTLLLDQNKRRPIYSDSMTAIAWIRNKKAKTTLVELPGNEDSHLLIKKYEKWMKENSKEINSCIILKWHTKKWGEIPADFGRK